MAGLQFLAKRRAGEISGPAARGLGDDGLSPELLKFALSLLAEAGHREAAGRPRGNDAEPDR